MVASEVYPYSKTGGLGDAAGALGDALARRGHDVTVITPLYATIDREAHGLQPLGRGAVALFPFGPVWADLWRSTKGEARVLFVDQPRYFDRPYLYDPPGGHYYDNAERFAFLCWAALDAMAGEPEPVDVLHAHDWQTALVPYFRRHMPQPQFARATSVLTIHNLAHQGNFPVEASAFLGPTAWEDYLSQRAEFHGQWSFLKMGIIHADAINTVSPTHAREILTPEFGFGMDGALRMRSPDLVGILNGADYDVWNPETDAVIPARFSARNRKPKVICRAELRKRFGLPELPGVPVIGMVGRLSSQKGWDLIGAVLDRIASLPLQLAILGSGDPRYEHMLHEARHRHPERIAFHSGYSEDLAHWITAGSDMFLMPSAYEPCGLSQLYAMRYGTIPIVHATGGLEDSVTEVEEGKREGDGFKFRHYAPDALIGSLERALALFARPREWSMLVSRAMGQEFSWARAAEEYEHLFDRTLARRGRER
ncbi:MAG: glycogen synthase GlgA [Myxococcales bacterium]|nr:glycogen synthase GlgA [Myxococcales bacterium]